MKASLKSVFIAVFLFCPAVSLAEETTWDFTDEPDAYLCLSIVEKLTNTREFKITESGGRRIPPFYYATVGSGTYEDDFGDEHLTIVSCTFAYLKETKEYVLTEAKWNDSKVTIIGSDMFESISIFANIVDGYFGAEAMKDHVFGNEMTQHYVELQLAYLNKKESN